MSRLSLRRRSRTGPSDSAAPALAAPPRRATAEALEARRLLTTYYVDDVSANGNGSSGSPYNTIQAAANVAVAGDTVVVRDGTYRETVRPANSGTASKPITFKVAPGATATVNGADRVSGWTPDANNVYKANMPWTLADGRDQVFVNGQMMFLARWPNGDLAEPTRPNWAELEFGAASGFETIGTKPDGKPLRKALYTMKDQDLPFTKDQVRDARVHVKGGYGWLSQTAPLYSSYDDSNGVVTFKGKFFDLWDPIYGPEAGDEYYLFGKEAFLDVAGEWFRRDDGTLLLRQPGGGDPDNSTVEAKRRDNGFDVSGRDHIKIEGLDFFATSIKTDGNTDGLTLDKVDFKYVDHVTRIEGGPDNLQSPWVVANDTGLRLRGSGHTLSNGTIKFSGGNGVKLEGSGHVVRGNVISHVNGVISGQAAAVFASGTGHLVEYNTLSDSTRNLVAIKAKNTRYLHNDLSRAMLQTNDGGAFYAAEADGEDASGRSQIAYNRVHDIAANGGRGTELAVGIYLDNGTSGHDVYRNIVEDVTHPFHQNGKAGKAHDNNIVNNTFIAGGNNAITVGTGGQAASQIDMGNLLIANNIAVRKSQTATSSINVDPNFNVAPQVRDNFDAAAFMGQGPGNLEAVKFVDPASDDWRLQSSSPAVGYAGVLPPYTNGYNGSAPDAGAIEQGDPMFAYGHAAAPVSGGGGQQPFGGVNRSFSGGATIEIEDFDTGGQDIAYNDTTSGNSGGSNYRAGSSVDLGTSSSASNNTFVGWTQNGEWLEYTVDAAAGTYDLTLTYASASNTPGDVRVKLGGQTLGTFATVNTGGWNTYKTVTLSDIAVTGGADKVLRLELVGGAINLDKVAAAAAVPAFPFSDGDVVRFESVAYGGTYLDAEGPNNGWDVTLRSGGTSTDRHWLVKDNGNNIFSFQSVAFASSNRWLDGDPGDNVDLRLGDDNPDTEWLVTDLGDGIVQLRNEGENGYLDADAGNIVDLRTDGSFNDTRWRATVVNGESGGNLAVGTRGSFDGRIDESAAAVDVTPRRVTVGRLFAGNLILIDDDADDLGGTD